MDFRPAGLLRLIPRMMSGFAPKPQPTRRAIAELRDLPPCGASEGPLDLADEGDGLAAGEGATSQCSERGAEAGDRRRVGEVPRAVGVLKDKAVVEEFEAAHRRHGRVGWLDEQLDGGQLGDDLEMPELLALDIEVPVGIAECGRAKRDHDVMPGLVEDALAAEACLDDAVDIDGVQCGRPVGLREPTAGVGRGLGQSGDHVGLILGNERRATFQRGEVDLSAWQTLIAAGRAATRHRLHVCVIEELVQLGGIGPGRVDPLVEVLAGRQLQPEFDT